MLISLHRQATTTPKIRAAIQASTEPAWQVAERYGISEQTVWKWRKRDSVHDRSHTAHRLQTTLTPAQEAVAVSLRRTLLLPLDDLLVVVREFLNPHVSRSGLDRCLRRHGVSRLQDLKPKALRPAHKPFKAYEPGYLHVDVKYLPQMAGEERRRYLFVAIDRATRWVFVRIYPAKTAANARRFLRDLDRAAPMKITRILTDNGKEFTDRLFGLRKRAATGNHEFDRLCAEFEIEHRLAPPMRPQTNGMVERFNSRIEDVLQSHRFRSGEDLEQTILRYVRLYNGQLPQSVLKGRTPIDALKDWHQKRPELFKKRPYNHTGCDNYGQYDKLIVMYQRECFEMTATGHDLLSYRGKILSLITIDGVKDWTVKGIGFQCAYDLVGYTADQKPRYRCIYVLNESSEAFVLVTTRVGKHGADVRLFNIWPGLFRHHNEFGDGRRLCFDREFGLALVP